MLNEHKINLIKPVIFSISLPQTVLHFSFQEVILIIWNEYNF